MENKTINAKNCRAQFLHNTDKKYRGRIKEYLIIAISMLQRGIGIRDISECLKISKNTVLRLLNSIDIKLVPLQKKYKELEVDELWSYVKHKDNKVWLIYAICAETKEIAAYTFGKRNAATVKKLYKQILEAGIEVERFCFGNWKAFSQILQEENIAIGKKYTTLIEGVSCHLRHIISRLVRMTCCFSKKLSYHIKVIELVLQNMNFGFSWARK
jgi:insertion element IS1 protein InsB